MDENNKKDVTKEIIEIFTNLKNEKPLSSNVNNHPNIPSVNKHFTISGVIAKGPLSHVYLAKLKNKPEKYRYSWFALKFISQTYQRSKIAQEMRVLQKLKNGTNILPLYACERFFDQTVLIFPYFPHDEFRDVYLEMSAEETRQYLKNLFQAVAYIHSHGIIHRDIKPRNFLYSRKFKKYLLIDFGLSTFIENSNDCAKERRKAANERICDSSSLLCDCFNKPQICRACKSRMKRPEGNKSGTSGFRAPEVLLGLTRQSYSLDMWSVGVIFLSILSGLNMIASIDNQVEEVASLRIKCLKLKTTALKSFPCEYAIPFISFSQSAYDLLDLLLQPNPDDRISAEACLKHSFIFES